MSRLKKVMGLMLAGTLSLGIAVSAYAAESVMRTPQHVHAFSVVNYVYYDSHSYGSHRYMSGYRVDADTGETMPVFSNCTLIEYQYRGEWKCACGATDGPAYKSELRHMDCGL